MRSSNFFAASLITVGGLLLGGCTLPQPQAKNSEFATYTIITKDPKVVQTTLVKDFSIPESRTFHFEACTTDVKTQKALINHLFTVEATDTHGTAKELVTDTAGCMAWDEAIKYNYFADARFVELNRTVTAKGVQKGSRLLRFGINPWESEAVDLDRTKIENVVPAKSSVAYLTNTTGGANKSIVATDLRVNITEKQTTTNNGTSFNLEVRGSPSIESKKATGEIFLDPIAMGSFKAQVHLIHSVAVGNKEVRRDLFTSEEININSIHGLINLKVPLTLPSNCGRGQYQLGLRLVPSMPGDSPAAMSISKLKPFEGVFLLAECDQIKGNFFAVLTNDSSALGDKFSIESYVNQSPELIDNVKSSGNTEGTPGFQKARYEFSSVVPTEDVYKNQDPVHREREFILKSCITSGVDNKVARAQTFSIQRKGSTHSNQVVSDNQGCLYWKDSITFNFLEKECESVYSYEITNKDLGVAATIPVLINPWNAKDSAFKDLSRIAIAPRCSAEKSELRAERYSYSKQEYRYSVDDYMNLRVQKIVNMNINFKLRQQSLTDPSKYVDTPAPIGKYKMKLALVDIDAEPSFSKTGKVYMTAEKEFLIKDPGTIAEELTLESVHLKEFGNTNKLWIELSSMESSANFKTTTFQAVLKLSDDKAAEDFRQVENGGISLVDKAQKLLAKEEQDTKVDLAPLATKMTTAKDLGLALLNLNVEKETQDIREGLTSPLRHSMRGERQLYPLTPVTTEHLRDWLKSGVMSVPLAERFCSYWINDKLKFPETKLTQPKLRMYEAHSTRILRECIKTVRTRPGNYFDIQYRYFVNKPKIVDGKHKSALVTDFAISNSFNFGKAFLKSHGENSSADVGFSIATPKLFGASASTGYRYSMTWGKQWSEQTGAMQTFVGSCNLKVEKVAIQVRAESYEKCAIIKLRPESYLDASSEMQQSMDPRMTKAQKASILSEGFMICSGEVSKAGLSFVENYYIMNQAPNSMANQITDSATERNRPFFIALRGDEGFSQFISFVHEGTILPESYHSEFQTKELLNNRHKALFLRGLPGSPGQHIAPR